MRKPPSIFTLGASLGSLIAGFGLLSTVAQAQPASITKITDSTQNLASGGFGNFSPSSDGRYVADILGAPGTGGINRQAYRYDRDTGTRVLISQSTAGATANESSFARPSLSADGRYAVFYSSATNLVPGDTNNGYDIFLRDITGQTTTAVSDVTDNVNAVGDGAIISADGAVVYYRFFDSVADYYVAKKYLIAGAVTSTVGEQSDQPLDVSADGRYVLVHRSPAVSAPGDSDGLFRVDTNSSTSQRVDVSTAGVLPNYFARRDARMSDDGRFVVFAARASNLVDGDTNGTDDIFLRDITSQTTTRLSVRSDGAQSTQDCSSPDISGNGRFVVFTCNSSQLVFGDSNDVQDVYAYDSTTGGLTEVSRPVSGAVGNGSSYSSAISADGAYVVFESLAENLVSGDSNAVSDVFLATFGSSVTVDQCLTDTAKLAPGDCGCGFLDTDTDSNGISDCLDPDGNTVPVAPTLSVKKKALTVSVAALPEPDARIIALAEKGDAITQKRGGVGKKKVTMTLPVGRYKVSVKFKRPGGIVTQESEQKNVKIK